MKMFARYIWRWERAPVLAPADSFRNSSINQSINQSINAMSVLIGTAHIIIMIVKQVFVTYARFRGRTLHDDISPLTKMWQYFANVDADHHNSGARVQFESSVLFQWLPLLISYIRDSLVHLPCATQRGGIFIINNKIIFVISHTYIAHQIPII
jgi:hypothetical protein